MSISVVDLVKVKNDPPNCSNASHRGPVGRGFCAAKHGAMIQVTPSRRTPRHSFEQLMASWEFFLTARTRQNSPY